MPRCGGCASASGGGSGGGSQWTVGDIKMSGSNDGESGWLLCSGQQVSRTTYAPLFAKIGTAYGSGDGVTTFNVPNLNQAERFPRGAVSPGGSGGEATHVLTLAEMPAHGHPVEGAGETAYHDYLGGGSTGFTVLRTNVTDGTSVSNPWSATTVGDGQAHNNLPPYVGVVYLIKT